MSRARAAVTAGSAKQRQRNYWPGSPRNLDGCRGYADHLPQWEALAAAERNIKPGMELHEAAAQEAYEEAGIIGRISDMPLGKYRAQKTWADGVPVDLAITLFPMLFIRQEKTWPEQGQRSFAWFTPTQAAEAVREPGLSGLVRSFHPLR